MPRERTCTITVKSLSLLYWSQWNTWKEGAKCIYVPCIHHPYFPSQGRMSVLACSLKVHVVSRGNVHTGAICRQSVSSNFFRKKHTDNLDFGEVAMLPGPCVQCFPSQALHKNIARAPTCLNIACVSHTTMHVFSNSIYKKVCAFYWWLRKEKGWLWHCSLNVTI